VRIGVTLLLLALCSPAAAQFAGAGRSGGTNSFQGGRSHGAGSPFPVPPFGPNFPSSFGTAVYQAQHPLWGSIAPSPPWGNGIGSGFIGSGFPCFPGNYPNYPAAYAVPFFGGDFAGGLYGPGYYPPQPLPQPPSNVTVVFPPQPPPVIVPPTAPTAETVSQLKVVAGNQAETVPYTVSREPALPSEYPALIAVKNGNLYSADRYWVKGRTFHFITTNGEHHQIPLAMLEHLYPARKSAH
jgi:hypothetical protein